MAVIRRRHPVEWVSSSQAQANAKSRAAEAGSAQGQLCAIAFDNVLDHGKADALPRVLPIKALAALEDAFALVGRHSWAVIFDPQFQIVIKDHQADPNLGDAQAVGVFQEIAEHLQQCALLHGHARRTRHIEDGRDRLVAVNLVQRIAQAVEQWRQKHLMTDQAALAQAG
jgi:hypothetical protein